MDHADIGTTMIYVHHVPQVDAAERLFAAIEAGTTTSALGGALLESASGADTIPER